MLNVLLVDDTKSVHIFMKALLAKSPGINIHSVYNGQQALEHIAQNPHFYNACFLDWEMPVLNGVETLREMQKMGLGFPVVMMTTKNNPEDIGLALSLGAAEYLMKPFTIDILFDKLETVTGSKLNYAV